TVTITATDEDGASTTTTFPLTVNEVLPSVGISGPAMVNEGSPYTLSLSFSDPGAHTPPSWTINWGDGTTATLVNNPSSATHVYADGPNSSTISARATTDDGTFAAGNTVTVSIQNVAPQLTVNNPAVVVNEGQTATNGGT